MDNKIYRQGDILIVPVQELPKGLKEKDNVLALGEQTGHNHVINGAVVYSDANGMQYLQIEKKAQLVHQEHKQIQIPKGQYQVKRQREYNPAANRMVMD